MAKPLINFWGTSSGNMYSEMRSMESQINNLITSGDPVFFNMMRSRGARGKLDPGVPGFPVGSAQNPAGNWPKASPIIKDDEVSAFTNGYLVSCELNIRMLTNTQGYNIPILWNDVVAGMYDQVILDKLQEPRWLQMMANPLMGHCFETGSELNIHQGMGDAQPSSASTQTGNTKYNEYKAFAVYFVSFIEGRNPGASGILVPPEFRVPPGKLKYCLTLGGQQFVQNKHGLWADGLQGTGCLHILGADAYTNPGETYTYRDLFEPCFEGSHDLGFQYGTFETGCASSLGATFKANWFRGAFDYIKTHSRADWYVATFTSFGDDVYTDPAGSLIGFADGMKALRDTPDIEPPPPPPPPPPGDFVPGRMAPWKKLMSAA